jgi:translation initiation factor eIF-2B subunit gamma
MYLYVFDREAVFRALNSRPSLSSIKQDLVPYLVRQQLSRQSPVLDRNNTMSSDGNYNEAQTASAPATDFMVLSHSDSRRRRGHANAHSVWCNVFWAEKDKFCARTNTLPAYADVNRDLTSFELASQLLTQKPNARFENFVHETVQIGNKSVVAAGCIVGKGSILGDKCSVKRSVIGATAKLGNNVKVVSSVIMDNVSIDEGCHIQNSVICSGARLHANCSLRECQVGHNFVVSEGSQHRDEELVSR